MQLGLALPSPDVCTRAEECFSQSWPKAPGEAQRQILWGLFGVEEHQGNLGHSGIWELDATPGGDCLAEMTCREELISESGLWDLAHMYAEKPLGY